MLEQLEEKKIVRSSGIGGTDIAAIVGLHPRADAFSVYVDKAGLLERIIDETDQRAQWGIRLQPAIAKAWSDFTRKPHEWIDRTLQGQAADFQIYTPDARSAAPRDQRILEIKTAGLDQAKKWGDFGSDTVPENYAVQCAWYMSAANVDLCDIAVLIGGNDFRIYTLRRDKEMEELLLDAGYEFWHYHVLARNPPNPGAGEASRDRIRRLFPRNVEALRPATEQEVELVDNLRKSKERFEAAEDEKKALENSLKLAIGDNEGLEVQGDKIVTWKKDSDTTGVNWEGIARELGLRIELLKPAVKEVVRPEWWDQTFEELKAANQVTTREGPRKLRLY
jgi:putative phage-type endonuclease